MRAAGLRFAPSAGVVVVRLLGKTCRIRFINLEAAASGTAALEATIYAMWHDQLLTMLVCNQHIIRGLGTLSSEHPDSEMIVRLVSRLGLRPIRGSSSRGGMRAMLALIRELKSGGSMVFTPDGPRGPRHKAAEGIIALAQLSGARIIPIACAMRPRLRVRSWDRLQIPAPFARGIVAGGEQLRVPADIDAATRETFRAELESRLESLTGGVEDMIERSP